MLEQAGAGCRRIGRKLVEIVAWLLRSQRLRLLLLDADCGNIGFTRLQSGLSPLMLDNSWSVDSYDTEVVAEVMVQADR